MKYAGGFLLVFFVTFVMTSLAMMRGVQKCHRGMILPWLVQNMLYVLLLIAYDIWLIASYYQFVSLNVEPSQSSRVC